jgi:excisionase family DNA binding protein
MSSELEKLIEREIEARARVLAEQMFAAAKKSEVPSEIAPNGEFITPFLFGGKKYLSRQQVESLLGVKYPALWKWKRDGKLSYHKAGGRLLFSYDDVHQLVNGAAAI